MHVLIEKNEEDDGLSPSWTPGKFFDVWLDMEVEGLVRGCFGVATVCVDAPSDAFGDDMVINVHILTVIPRGFIMGAFTTLEATEAAADAAVGIADWGRIVDEFNLEDHKKTEEIEILIKKLMDAWRLNDLGQTPIVIGGEKSSPKQVWARRIRSKQEAN